MFLAVTDQHLFCCTGKIGTRTILSLPNAVNLQSTQYKCDEIRKQTNKKILSILSTNPNLKLVVVIRDPIKRYLSGLFEIIGKPVIENFLNVASNEGQTKSFIDNCMLVFQSQEFWIHTLAHYYNMAPQNWDPKSNIPAYKWDFHVGNWLIVADKLQSTYNCDIIDITNLSEFIFNCYNIKKHPENTYEEFVNYLNEFAETPIQINSIFNSFVSAHECIPEYRKNIVSDYLIEEQQLYNKLTQCSKKII